MPPRILVTGAAGFLGSRLVRSLRSEGHPVAVILKESTNTWRISDILSDLAVIRGDLSDLSSVQEKLRRFWPECAAHLGWQGVGNRQRNDVTQMANLRWSLELLELVHAVGCRHYVALGSQAEYGPYSRTISEDFDTYPTTVYGMTKLCHYLQAREFCRTHQMRFAWLRLFSAYGPGDDPAWMIPHVIMALLRRKRPALTAGEQRWDYLYADDAAEALSRVIDSPDANGVFNLGSGDSHPLRCIVEQLRDVIDPSLPLGFGEIPYRPDQVMHLEADISRLTRITGWRPRTDLRAGLELTATWYMNRQNEGQRAELSRPSLSQ